MFNHLQDKAQRQAKALKMSAFSRHAYILTASTEQIRPTRLDFLQFDHVSTGRFLENVQPYTTAHAQIPVDEEGNLLASPELVRKHWRKAGFHANRDAVSALAFVMETQPADVRELERDLRGAWAGAST